MLEIAPIVSILPGFVFLTARLLKTSARLLIFLDGQTGIDPVLLAPIVIPHVGVTQGRQFTGGAFRGVSSGAGAIDDDISVFVRQEIGRQFSNLRWRQVDCTRQVRRMIHVRWQCLNQFEIASAIDLRFQFISRDCRTHSYLHDTHSLRLYRNKNRANVGY